LGANLGNVLVWIKGYFNLVCVSGRDGKINDDTGFADTLREIITPHINYEESFVNAEII